MTNAYGHSAPSYCTDAKWVAEFKDLTGAYRDAPRSSRLSTALTDESIRAVEEVVMWDRQISVRSIADELGISKTSLYKIMNDYLGMKKVCTRWAPKLLTSLQRANQVDCCEELLENCNQDATRFVGSIVTGDETWIHHYDPLSNKKQRPGRNLAKRHQPDHESHDRPERSSKNHLLGL